jgi:hypothetical protein
MFAKLYTGTYLLKLFVNTGNVFLYFTKIAMYPAVYPISGPYRISGTLALTGYPAFGLAGNPAGRISG